LPEASAVIAVTASLLLAFPLKVADQFKCWGIAFVLIIIEHSRDRVKFVLMIVFFNDLNNKTLAKKEMVAC
jgi:hypothetical protein